MPDILFTSDWHGAWKNALLAILAGKQLGVEGHICAGDMFYGEQDLESTVNSNHFSQLQNGLATSIASGRVEGIFKDIKKGLYSDEQFNEIIDNRKKAKKTYEKRVQKTAELAKAVLNFGKEKGIDSQTTFGNHTPAQYAELIEDGAIAGIKQIWGIDVSIMGGGGPQAGMPPVDTFADSQDNPRRNMELWQETISQEWEDSGILLTHVDPVKKGQMGGIAQQQLESILGQAKEKQIKNSEGYKFPVLFNGHSHKTEVNWIEKYDTFNVNCGSLADSHNTSPTFMITQFSDDQVLEKVIQYEITQENAVLQLGFYDISEGKQPVFKEDRQEIIAGQEIEQLKEQFGDKFFPEKPAGKMNLDYESIRKSGSSMDQETAKKLDLQVRKNVAALDQYIRHLTEDLGSVMADSARNYLEECQEITNTVRDNIIEDIEENLLRRLEQMGFNYDAISSDSAHARHFINTIFGIDYTAKVNALNEIDLSEPNKHTQWVRGVTKEAGEKLRKGYFQIIFAGIERDDWIAMGELGLPQGATKQDGHFIKDPMGFWAEARFYSPLASREVTEKYGYNVPDPINPKKEQWIADTFEVGSYELSPTERIERLESQIEDYIKDGGKVIEAQGDHYVTGEEFGGATRIPESLKETLEYETVTEGENFVNDLENGDLPVLKDDSGAEYIMNPENPVQPIPLKELTNRFGIDPGDIDYNTSQINGNISEMLNPN